MHIEEVPETPRRNKGKGRADDDEDDSFDDGTDPEEDPSDPPIGGSGGGSGGGGPPGGGGGGGHGPPQGGGAEGFFSAYATYLTTHNLLLQQMLREKAKPKKGAKPKDPETFNGSDPTKLKNFLTGLQLQFNHFSESFVDSASKVNYGLSFLRGIALDYFEPDLLGSEFSELDPPAWMVSYRAWVVEL